MALTRITKGVIKPNENYDTHNINSTGIITAIGLDVNGNADVSGTLSVGGVLTYEDVTSIDSVGIITAQKDIHVGAGVSVVGIVTASTFKGDGDFVDIDVDGHTNLDNVSVSGISTFSGILDATNTPASIRVAQDIQHKGDADTKISFDTNRINLDTGGINRVSIADTGFVVNDEVYINGNQGIPLRIEGSLGTTENIHIRNYTSGGHIQFGFRQNDSDGHHHRAYITVSKGTGSVSGKLELKVRGQGGGTNRGFILDAGVGIQANQRFLPETDSIYDLGSNTLRWQNLFVDDVTVTGVITATQFVGDGSTLTGIDATALKDSAGNVKIQANNSGAVVTGILTVTSDASIGGNFSIPDKIIHTDDTNTSIRFPSNDNISFEVGGVERLRINSNGIAVTGAVEPTGHVKLDDDRFIYFGTGDDFIIGHQPGTPQNVFRSTDGATKMIFQGGSETMMVLHPQAQVELYYDNSKKLETTSVGTRLYGRTDIGDSTGGSTDDRLAFGDSQDLQIFHDGSTNRINASNGNLTIQAVTQHNIVLSYAGENMLVAKPDGAVELYYNATKRFETTSAGITVTGTVDSASDVILKENIKTIDNALDKVTKLRGVEYDYKDNKKHSIGVIAQEVEEVLPELVNGSEQKSVAYGNIAAVLIEAIKEQNVVINKMKKEIEDLKG